MSPIAPPDQLSDELRLRLVRFACSFAWLDGGPQPQDWHLVNRLAERLGLPPEARLKVRDWLTTQPPADDIHLETLPREHRRLFLTIAKLVADADGHRHQAEESALTWLTQSIVEMERGSSATR